MPAIVPQHLLLAPGLGEVHLKEGLVTHGHSSHDKFPFSCACRRRARQAGCVDKRRTPEPECTLLVRKYFL
jgi:hypothetical protein